MIRVVALTSGPDAPSSRFRVRQYIAPLGSRGISVSERHLGYSKFETRPERLKARLMTLRKLGGRVPGVLASRRADVTWIQRELIPGRMTLEGLTKRPRLLDVDDAIWLNGKAGFSERIAEASDGVIAGNAFLAAHYRAAGNRVWVVPTSIDTNRWTPRPRPAAREFTIGWIGTGSNLGYLLDVEAALAEFLAEEREARLLVVSDLEPRFAKLPKGKWTFERWTAEREIELVQRMDVGLMPLPDSEWARGKCSCKMLNYMAVGIPVVVSPVGVNLEILERGEVGLPATTKNDWFDALKLLFDDRDRGARLGSAGRETVVNDYSVAKNVVHLEKIFREVAR